MIFSKIAIFYAISLMSLLYPQRVESLIIVSNPFWMPLEFDLGKGYFKANVFIYGLQKDTGLVKICITINTQHKLCHYMDAVEEEGQIINSHVSVHAGLFVFPSTQVPIDAKAIACLTILKSSKTFCEEVDTTLQMRETTVDFHLS
jgi:hypothetical protein